MRNYLSWIVPVVVVFGMGIAMPSCTDQQAHQQIDALHNSNVELGKKVQALDAQVANLVKDMNQVKQLLPQMTNVIQAQKGALDELSNNVKTMQTVKAAPAKGAKKKK